MTRFDTTIAIFNYILLTQMNEGRIPAYREITKAVGLSAVSNIHRHIHKLVSWGWIEKPPHEAVAIRITRGPHIEIRKRSGAKVGRQPRRAS